MTAVIAQSVVMSLRIYKKNYSVEIPWPCLWIRREDSQLTFFSALPFLPLWAKSVPMSCRW